MAATPDRDYVRFLRPFRIISPFSITVAATHRYRKSAVYFACAILTLLPPTALGWYHVLARENHKYILFNTDGIAFTFWAMNSIVNGYLIVTLGKERNQKFIREMQKLDRLLSFRDDALVEKMIVHNKVWLIFIFGFHVISVLHCAFFLDDPTLIGTYVLFVTVDIAMISEAACFSCFALLVYTRLRYYVSHVKLLLSGKRRDNGTAVAPCYRQIHRVLERLEKACQVQIAVLICFCFYSCLHVCLTFIQTPSTTESIWFNLFIMTRYLSMFLVLGALGRAVASQLTLVRHLAFLMEHSPDGDLQSAGRRISTEAEVRPCGLQVLGVAVDGELPLRVCGTLASAIILLLQLGVNLASD